MDGPATLAALTPDDAGEVLTLWRGQGADTRLLLAAEDLLPPQVRITGLRTGQHSHANVRLHRRPGDRQRHTTRAGACQLAHLARARTHRSAAASFWPGRS